MIFPLNKKYHIIWKALKQWLLMKNNIETKWALCFIESRLPSRATFRILQIIYDEFFYANNLRPLAKSLIMDIWKDLKNILENLSNRKT